MISYRQADYEDFLKEQEKPRAYRLGDEVKVRSPHDDNGWFTGMITELQDTATGRIYEIEAEDEDDTETYRVKEEDLLELLSTIGGQEVFHPPFSEDFEWGGADVNVADPGPNDAWNHGFTGYVISQMGDENGINAVRVRDQDENEWDVDIEKILVAEK